MAGFQNPSPDLVYAEPLTFTIDGKEYKMNRVRIKDISAVYGRIRDNRLKALMRNLRGAPDNVAAQAYAHAACIDPTDADYWKYANTPAGQVFITWRCLEPHQRGITEDEVEMLIEKEAEMFDLLLGESGLSKPDEPIDPDSEGENGDPLPVFGGPKNPSTGSKEAQ